MVTLTPVPAHRPDHLPKAMVYMVLSGLCFAMMGAAVKLSGDLPLPTKVFFRNLVTLGITSAVAIGLRQNPFGAAAHLKWLLLRSVSGLLGVFLYFLALGQMNLADASLLNKTSPFFVAVFAVLFLGEKLNRTVVVSLVVAFLGAMLVIKPTFDASMLPALAGLGSGLFAGVAYTIVRGLKGRVNPNRIIFYFSLVSCTATLPFLIAAPPSPDRGQWLALIGTGIFAAGGQYGLTYAYHYARASRISIFTYLHVLFALGVGFLIWGERPDVLSWIGGGMIVGAALASQRRPRGHRAAIPEALTSTTPAGRCRAPGRSADHG